MHPACSKWLWTGLDRSRPPRRMCDVGASRGNDRAATRPELDRLQHDRGRITERRGGARWPVRWPDHCVWARARRQHERYAHVRYGHPAAGCRGRQRPQGDGPGRSRHRGVSKCGRRPLVAPISGLNHSESHRPRTATERPPDARDARMISRARVSWQRLDRARTSSPQVGGFLNRVRVGAPNFAQATATACTRGSAGRLTHPPGAHRPAVPQVRAPGRLALAFAPDTEPPVPWPYGCFHKDPEVSTRPDATSEVTAFSRIRARARTRATARSGCNPMRRLVAVSRSHLRWPIDPSARDRSAT